MQVAKIIAKRTDDEPDMAWSVDRLVYEEFGKYPWTYGITGGHSSTPYSSDPELSEKFGVPSVYLTRIIMNPTDPRTRVQRINKTSMDLRRKNLRVADKAGPPRKTSLKESGSRSIGIRSEKREVWVVTIGKKETIFFKEREARSYLKEKL